jgi:hypothetical protein
MRIYNRTKLQFWCYVLMPTLKLQTVKLQTSMLPNLKLSTIQHIVDPTNCHTSKLPTLKMSTIPQNVELIEHDLAQLGCSFLVTVIPLWAYLFRLGAHF